MRLGRAIVLLILVAAGCAGQQPAVNATQVQRERAVANWLNCDECWNRQFEHLVALGPEVIPILERYLTGREPCETDAREATLRTTYVRILRVADGGLGETEDEFVQRHLDAYCGRVKQRAAAAVNAIAPRELPRELRPYRRYQLVEQIEGPP